MNKLTTFYRSRLPHYTPIGGTFFVTFRIQDAVPLAVMQALQWEYSRTIQTCLPDRGTPREKRELIHAARYAYFKSYDKHLDAGSTDRCFLREPVIAQQLAAHLHAFDGTLYDLRAFCIMPNLVHLLISLGVQLVDQQNFYLDADELAFSYLPLNKVMQRIKGGSAHTLNQALRRFGKLWQKDSYDHFVRNSKAYDNILYYILYNPEKAGLVSHWKDYPFTFYK